MGNLSLPLKFYNLAGKYSKSEKEFKKYLKKELKFYRKLSDLANHSESYQQLHLIK